MTHYEFKLNYGDDWLLRIERLGKQDLKKKSARRFGAKGPLPEQYPDYEE